MLLDLRTAKGRYSRAPTASETLVSAAGSLAGADVQAVLEALAARLDALEAAAGDYAAAADLAALDARVVVLEGG